MSEYIDRDKALTAFCNFCGVCPEEKRDPAQCDDILGHVLKELEPADVRPVVRGKWEFMETENIWSHAELSHFYIQCSICKSQFFTDTPKLRFAYEYCPCCGADMREA